MSLKCLKSAFLRAILRMAAMFPLIAAECFVHLIESTADTSVRSALLLSTDGVSADISQLATVGDVDTRQFVGDFFAHLCKEQNDDWSKVKEWAKSRMESLTSESREWTIRKCSQLMDELTTADDVFGIVETLRVATTVFDANVGFDEKRSVFESAVACEKHWAVVSLLLAYLSSALHSTAFGQIPKRRAAVCQRHRCAESNE